MSNGLGYLPTELYDAILLHLEAEANDHREFQQSLLALSRAIPRAPLPLEALYRQIILSKPQQANSLYLHLQKNGQYVQSIRTFRYETFEADADIVVNLLAMLHAVTDLTLFIGPNFAPEHLEEMFEHPRTILQSLSLRFRPYVQKATYFQFHKGAYFDSMATLISAWPRASLPQLSIVQDPLDPSIAPTKQFAQPLVFFRLDPISTLSASPYASTVASLRLRIPTRQVTSYLHRYNQSLPEIRFLDIATCQVGEGQLAALLADLESLQTLVLDGCPVVSQRADALEAENAEALGQWRSLGKALALVTVKRAKQKERVVKAWYEEQQQAAAAVEARQAMGLKKTRRGRRGLATATISLRGPGEELNPNGLKPIAPLPPPKVPNSGEGKEEAKPHGQPLKAKESKPPKVAKDKYKSATTDEKPGRVPRKLTSVRVLPSPPALRSLAITAPMVSVSSKDFKDRVDAIRREFEAGWASGTKTMFEVRGRVKTSWHNGIARVLLDKTTQRLSDDDSQSERGSGGGGQETSEGSDSGSSSNSRSTTASKTLQRAQHAQVKDILSGLRDATVVEDFELELSSMECPVLCLAGPQKSEFHAVGCPHEIGWSLWNDEI